MKSSSDPPTKGPCKEEDIMCIFKDVPNFLSEETSQENTCWLQGSYQDILVGKKSGPLKELSEKETRTKIDKENVSDETRGRSSSDDNIPETSKKKIIKTHFFDSIEITLPYTPLQKQNKESEKGFDLEELCKDCYWVVKLLKEQSSDSSFSEDEEYASKLREFQLKNKTSSESRFSEKDSSDSDLQDKNTVNKLLKEVQTCILESCIILGTGKLYNRLQKKSKTNLSVSEIPSEDVLDEIMADEEITDKTSKLCLALGHMVTKYLHIK